MEDNKKIIKTIKILPWLNGLTNDLLFYIAINTLFLTVVKGFTTSQISLFTSIPCLCYIIFQPLLLKLIKKIGNKKSVILGCFMLFVASIIITFAHSFYAIMIGQVLYTLAYIFLSMKSVILKNNLDYINKKDDFIKILNKGNVIYSTATTVIALFSGYLFKLNCYLPMYFCIFICFVNLIVSFSLNESIKKSSTKNEYINNKFKFNKIIFLILISYGIFYSTIGRSQSNIKLLIQYSLNDLFNSGDTAVYLSYILLLSRIMRIISNLLFDKVYNRLKEKVGYYIAFVSILALIMVILGYNSNVFIVKYVFMILGFCLIVGIRDIFGTFSKDIILKKSKVEEQQSAISYLELVRKIFEFILSTSFSIILLKYDIIYVINILLVLGIISFLINFIVYKNLKKRSNSNKTQFCNIS